MSRGSRRARFDGKTPALLLSHRTASSIPKATEQNKSIFGHYVGDDLASLRSVVETIVLDLSIGQVIAMPLAASTTA